MPYQGSEKQRQDQRAYEQRNADAIRARRPKLIATFKRRHLFRYMLQRAKSSAKERGFEFTVTVEDVVWPTHCPVLGMRLCYDWDKKKEQPNRSNYPSLDRWDNSQGYVPGNVFVISWLANQTKSRLTVAEMEGVVRYMKAKPSMLGVSVVDPKTLYPDLPYLHKNTPDAIKAKVEALGWEFRSTAPVTKQGAVRGRVTIYCSKHDYMGTPLVEKLMYMGQGCRQCGLDRLRLPRS